MEEVRGSALEVIERARWRGREEARWKLGNNAHAEAKSCQGLSHMQGSSENL